MHAKVSQALQAEIQRALIAAVARAPANEAVIAGGEAIEIEEKA